MFMRERTLYLIAYTGGLPLPLAIICSASVAHVISQVSTFPRKLGGRIRESTTSFRGLVWVRPRRLLFLSSRGWHLVNTHLTRDQASLSGHYICGRRAPRLLWCCRLSAIRRIKVLGKGLYLNKFQSNPTIRNPCKCR